MSEPRERETGWRVYRVEKWGGPTQWTVYGVKGHYGTYQNAERARQVADRLNGFSRRSPQGGRKEQDNG